MSLQLWFPFNGNLKNQGLSSSTLVSCSPTYTDGYVSNECLSVTDTNGAVTYPVLNDKESYTICCWFKVNKYNSNNTIFCNGSDMGSGWYLRFEGSLSSLCLRVFDTVKSYGDIVANKWYHACVGIDNTNKKAFLYINGIKVLNIDSYGKKETYTKGGFNIGKLRDTHYHLNGCINDFRVYKGIISPYLIKEIAKGLSVHYRLCSSLPKKLTESDCSGMGDTGTFYKAKPIISATSPRNTKCYTFGSTNSIVLSKFAHSWTTNFTVSVWAKLPKSPTSGANYIFTEGRADAGGYGFGISCSSTTFTAMFGNLAINSDSYTTDTWHHLCIVVSSDSTLSFYIDGVLKKSEKPSVLPTYSDGKKLGVGGFRYGIKGESLLYPHNSSISDFRLYHTALNENDIKDLYSSPIKIDNNGILYCSELYDISNNKDMIFYKNGVVEKEVNYKKSNGITLYDIVEI